MHSSIGKNQAIQIALEKITSIGCKIRLDSPTVALERNNDRPFANNRTGWIVFVPIEVPEGVEPDEQIVEVYNPDGKVYMRRMI